MSEEETKEYIAALENALTRLSYRATSKGPVFDDFKEMVNDLRSNVNTPVEVVRALEYYCIVKGINLKS